ncbi:hypothetical protein NA57DRAFT_71262 [Rhizodiscina lignyota]|uniref:Homeobox domain-containing protein n=1 Tax=Rhizodiscina lignyota TaxID=1504668 RepID=A0A9P4IS03_9PEZI|nr:hypothetical protein NA57DRAFT_71262 [Rhizodiscina lignyota]
MPSEGEPSFMAELRELRRLFEQHSRPDDAESSSGEPPPSNDARMGRKVTIPYDVRMDAEALKLLDKSYAEEQRVINQLSAGFDDPVLGPLHAGVFKNYGIDDARPLRMMAIKEAIGSETDIAAKQAGLIAEGPYVKNVPVDALNLLEQFFEDNPNPNPAEVALLSRGTRMTRADVNAWFVWKKNSILHVEMVEKMALADMKKSYENIKTAMALIEAKKEAKAQEEKRAKNAKKYARKKAKKQAEKQAKREAEGGETEGGETEGGEATESTGEEQDEEKDMLS